MIGQVFDSDRVALISEVRVGTVQVLPDIVLQVQFVFGNGLGEQVGGKCFGDGADLLDGGIVGGHGYAPFDGTIIKVVCLSIGIDSYGHAIVGRLGGKGGAKGVDE